VTDRRAASGGPSIRLVVLNYNGGGHIVRCLEALTKLDWPADRLDLVVVDNASADGSDRLVEERFGDTVRLVRNRRNTGFPANNLALRDVADGQADVDYVGLVNPDSFVDSGWLRPLVAALEADAELGAASARLVFADRFVEVEIGTPTFVPGVADQRNLGVMVSGATVDGRDRWRDTQIAEGGWGIEHARDGSTFQWTRGRAVVRAPVPDGDDPSTAGRLRLRLCAEGDKTVVLRCGHHVAEVTVTGEPTWFELPYAGAATHDVVNNVGSVVFDDGYGADRGYLELDEGQYDEAADVFAWCGGSVLFRPAYLADVGLFDERFFLYYEDTDLSWRGQSRGWRYRYVPEARARHIHAASTGEGTSTFQHYVERNRLVMLVKNAPRPMATRAVGRYLLVTASYARRDVVRPLLRARRPNVTQLRRRLMSFASFCRLVPHALRQRRRIRRRAEVGDDQIRARLTPHGR
jgi:GT2 family glycosyltransferase